MRDLCGSARRKPMSCRAKRTSPRLIRQVDERHFFSVVRELLAFRQCEVRRGFARGEPVRKTHRTAAEGAGAVAVPDTQALKMKHRAAAIAATQLSLAAELGARGELPDAGYIGRLLGMNGERSCAVEVAFCLAEKELTGEDGNHHPGRGKKPRSRHARRHGESGARSKHRDRGCPHARSDGSSPRDHSEKEDHERDYKQYVNESADRVGRDESEGPQDEKQSGDGVEHVRPPWLPSCSGYSARESVRQWT